ncbi:hypothetical protein AAVH_38121 [Aphelenchoides avenae]|nr:hypothetical protein AAVH_38121 [Aphelenchus avenae]
MSVLLGRFCPVGLGARAIWKFEDVAKKCSFTLRYIADGDPDESPKYNAANRRLSTSWNPVRIVFQGSKVIVSNADDDEKRAELRCSFTHERNKQDTIYDIIVSQSAPEGACMGTMHIPNWMEAHVRRTRDGFLHPLQTIPENSPYFAHDDVWLPRAEKYIEDAEVLLDEEYELDKSRIPREIGGNLTTIFRVTHGRKLMFVLLPLEGRTCVGGHASR